MKQRRVVVTGIGTINPLGNSIEEYFSNLEKGVSGAGPITHFDPSNFKTKFACELKGYDAASFFDRKELRKYDLYSQYALVAAEQAVKDFQLYNGFLTTGVARPDVLEVLYSDEAVPNS